MSKVAEVFSSLYHLSFCMYMLFYPVAAGHARVRVQPLRLRHTVSVPSAVVPQLGAGRSGQRGVRARHLPAGLARVR